MCCNKSLPPIKNNVFISQQVNQEERTKEDTHPSYRPKRFPSELLLRSSHTLRGINSALASFNIRSLLRRRGRRLGDAELLQRDLHEGEFA